MRQGKRLKPSNIADAVYHPAVGLILYFVAAEDHEVTIATHPTGSESLGQAFLSGWFAGKHVQTAYDHDGYLIPVKCN